VNTAVTTVVPSPSLDRVVASELGWMVPELADLSWLGRGRLRGAKQSANGSAEVEWCPAGTALAGHCPRYQVSTGQGDRRNRGRAF
jgi:hypothetical protein